MLNRFTRFKPEKKDLIFLGIIFLVYFAQKLFSYKLGIYMEECRDANAHLMALNGQLPYQSSGCWFYGPFAFLIYPLMFKIFGVSLVTLRLSYIIIASFVIFIVYYLSKRLMPASWSALAAFLSIVLIDVPYYTYNHILATVAGLLVLLFIVRFIEQRDSIRNLFFAGLFIGISLLVKPFFIGFGILFFVFLVICLLEVKRIALVDIKSGHIAMLTLGILSILIPFLSYFAIQGSLHQLLTHITPFGANRASGFFIYSDRLFLPSLNLYWQSLRDILPYRIIFAPFQWKTILVRSHDKLILLSPVIFPLAIVLLNKYIFRKYKLISKKDMAYFSLYTLFTISVSLQSLFTVRHMGRSFTMQVPFIIIVYFLFLVNNRKLYQRANLFRYAVIILSAGLISSLSLLHFFRYPYSRYKKYIVPLELERAKEIRVTYPEKELYESLNTFLSKNTSPDEVIGVLGHCPTLSFLCQRHNILNGENISLKLRYFSKTAKSNPVSQKGLKELEDNLINKLKLKKPRFILEPVEFTKEYPQTRLNEYVEQAYALEKTLGPAEIDIYSPGIVRIYRLKE